MNIAFCYESVLPERGGCETYIADLARHLAADRHELHLYACRWDAHSLPDTMQFHQIAPIRALRFVRPWKFSQACLSAMTKHRHDVSVGFDKTFGQDVLYPLGGLHAATFEHNLRKFATPWQRNLARGLKYLDLAHQSYLRLEQQQYLTTPRPQIVVNSEMVRRHFHTYLGISEQQIEVVRSAIDPHRFPQHDRPRVRTEGRQRWGLLPTETVALFVAKNYRLKGLSPLLRGLQAMLRRPEFEGRPPSFRLLVCGNDAIKPFEREARALGLELFVRFAGQSPDIREAFFASDFLIHPTFYDPCSLVVLEALACDLPIITTRFNGASELIQHGQEGFVLDDPHDAATMGSCIAQLLDPARRRSCALAARRAAAAWTFEHHYQQLLNVLEKVHRRKHAA